MGKCGHNCLHSRTQACLIMSGGPEKRILYYPVAYVYTCTILSKNKCIKKLKSKVPFCPMQTLCFSASRPISVRCQDMCTHMSPESHNFKDCQTNIFYSGYLYSLGCNCYKTLWNKDDKCQKVGKYICQKLSKWTVLLEEEQLWFYIYNTSGEIQQARGYLWRLHKPVLSPPLSTQRLWPQKGKRSPKVSGCL